ncbi:hypothetical protein [Lignipirellula cremea]|uniref:Double zinc ribbon n=1 Tax=Lignipirellula cremea TaxID=2528010 RepID=A0A518DX74_9BACT|nr:hypothetical protein [Lignipirellula cremea]QDU96422.1 hypothetical protein Pla8534_42420 [Lignipirellula cremea]
MTEHFIRYCSCGAQLPAAAEQKRGMLFCAECGRTTPAQAEDEASDASTDRSSAEAAAMSFDGARKPSFPCPACNYPMAEGSVVCVDCGYHKRLGHRLKTVDNVARDRSKLKLAIGLIPSCLAFIGASYFVQQGLDGVQFLQLFFVMFLMVGLGVLLARKLALDTDYFNYAAMAMMVGVGSVRVYCSLMEGKTKVAFLVLGMTISLCVFLLARTESENEASEGFIDSQGGLSWWMYLGMFGSAALLLGAVFFVPVVRDYGAQVGYLGSAAAGLLTANFLNMLPVSGNGDGGFFSSCSSSSCSSGCGGGGCGGGGCGGCGS